jgi:hypothetical protein
VKIYGLQYIMNLMKLACRNLLLKSFKTVFNTSCYNKTLLLTFAWSCSSQNHISISSYCDTKTRQHQGFLNSSIEQLISKQDFYFQYFNYMDLHNVNRYLNQWAELLYLVVKWPSFYILSSQCICINCLVDLSIWSQEFWSLGQFTIN